MSEIIQDNIDTHESDKKKRYQKPVVIEMDIERTQTLGKLYPGNEGEDDVAGS